VTNSIGNGKPAPAPTNKPDPAPGVVNQFEVYRLKELARRLGWHEHALRQARAAGLPMIVFGREKFILGSDVLDFFRRLADRQAAGNSAEGE
jgi:hypothetical protein